MIWPWTKKPRLEYYFGGRGTKRSSVNIDQLNSAFHWLGGERVQSVMVGNGGNPYLCLEDPVVYKRKLRMPWDDHRIPGLRVNVNFNRVEKFAGAYPDEQVVAGVFDQYLIYNAKLMSDIRDDIVAGGKTPFIALTPMSETFGVGRSTLTNFDKRPRYSHGIESHYFKEAFEHIVRITKEYVKVDHVVCHLRAPSLEIISAYLPEKWDSYGHTFDWAKTRRGQGTDKYLPSELYEIIWTQLKAMGYGDRSMSLPEFSTPDGDPPVDGVRNAGNWEKINDVFRMIEKGRIPISLLSWVNKDPYNSPWGYGELRWQMSDPWMFSRWIEETRALTV